MIGASRRPKVMVVSEPAFAGVKRHVSETLRGIDREYFDTLFVYSMGRADATFADGRLFVSSGYGQAERPANALIALAPE